jgi:hypothetical protein
MRRILLESARRLATGQAPLADPRTIDYPAIRPVMGMVTEAERWQDLDATATGQPAECLKPCP